MKKTLIVGGLMIVAFFVRNRLSAKPIGINSPQVQGIIQETSRLSPQQFNDLLQSNDYVLLDIRTSVEYTTGHLKNSRQIDYYQTQAFSNYLDTLDKNSKYLIYCRTGKRSGAALQLMREKGFASAADLSGGYNAWAIAGLLIER